jgi:exopolysaccharide biosynthesis polyprenyl glycosylphosphotransferase
VHPSFNVRSQFRYQVLQRLARLFDITVAGAAFLVAFAVASNSYSWLKFTEILTVRVQLFNVVFVGIYTVICSAIFANCGLYVSARLPQWQRQVRDIFVAVTILTAILLALRWPFEFTFASDRFLVMFWCFTFSALALARLAGLQLLYALRSRGGNRRSVLVVGRGSDAIALGNRIDREHTWGYRLLGIIDAEESKTEKVSVVDQIDKMIAYQAVDEVLLALPMNQYATVIEAIVRHCEEQGIVVRVQTQFFDLQIARLYADELQGIPVITIQSGPTDGWPLATKRLMDVVFSGALLVALAPLFIVVALLIKLDSHGPVFFKQERVGLNKRRFKILKFRTMVIEAEAQQALVEHLNEVEGPVFKIKKDPRLTRIGALLRRFSIDELPQLVNVLNGEMSLVGPRPLPVRDVERIDAHWHKRRFSIKPGITCLWQVNGRSNIGFNEWVRMDLDYIDKWSLALDLLILIKTVPAVFKGPGAY